MWWFLGCAHAAFKEKQSDSNPMMIVAAVVLLVIIAGGAYAFTAH